MLPSVKANFQNQAAACRDLGSPFTAMLCEVLAENLRPDSLFGDRISHWPGHPLNDALALRAAGGLHALARSGQCRPLTDVYPPHSARPGDLWAGVQAAIAGHDAFLATYLDSAPQTNEVARSNAILGGFLHVARMTGLPLDIYEIGSSAGLNLGFDHYSYDLAVAHWNGGVDVKIQSRWSGNPPDTTVPIVIARRRGCDLNPLDPRSDADCARLLSYIWADQTERAVRTGAALLFAATAHHEIERSDAAAWVERALTRPALPGHVRVLFHTIVWQYLPRETKRRIGDALKQAGSEASKDFPLAWLRIEPDEIKGSASIRLTLWPDGSETVLGRADFHGRWTHWA
jgi:hypothetical protein